MTSGLNLQPLTMPTAVCTICAKKSRWVFMLATHVCALIRDLFVWVSAIQIQETVQNGSQKIYF